ncbi:hypothetical protein [Trueperella sp. LYQ143]|uniref:AMIN-like domain-containing (lipo)protein n=1 Tax=Trueperella sp. LYQ143 TaxID=3391059 RepID=UPI0039837F1A
MKRITVSAILLITASVFAGCSSSTHSAPSSPAPTAPSSSAATESTSPSASPAAPTTAQTTPGTLPADCPIIAPDHEAHSANWPQSSTQLLPISISADATSVTVTYDGEGIPQWHSSGWAATAYEDGSGLPIDLGSPRLLQIAVTGIRLPEAHEWSARPTLGATGAILGGVVSAPFEGSHRITLGAAQDMPYCIQTLESPTRIVIHFATTP